MKKFILSAILAVPFIINTQLWAQDNIQLALTCETPRQNYFLQIAKNSVSFMLPIYENGKVARRFPASSSSLINSIHGKNALLITTYFETKRFKIFINLEHQGFEGSTISVRSRDGHEMTSPLSCQKL
jgi:hypothetical protein